MSRDMRQMRCAMWVRDTFGSLTMERPEERAARVLEEAVELAQAAGVPREIADRITGYVYARPPGNVGQELGGIGVTLLAAAQALGYSADQEEAAELARVLALPPDYFRRRHDEKRDAGITPGIHANDQAPLSRNARRWRWPRLAARFAGSRTA